MVLRKFGFICGIVGPCLWLLLIIIAGALRPGFSHVTQYISELAESGSSTEFLMRFAGFELSGVFYLCFAAALKVTFRDDWLSMLGAGLIALDGAGRIGAGVFPCDPGCIAISSSQESHHLFATIGFLSGILATIVWSSIFRFHHQHKKLTWYSVGSGSIALILLILMDWSGNPLPYPGLFEHLASVILSVWVMFFAIHMLRIPDGAE